MARKNIKAVQNKQQQWFVATLANNGETLNNSESFQTIHGCLKNVLANHKIFNKRLEEVPPVYQHYKSGVIYKWAYQSELKAGKLKWFWDYEIVKKK